MSILASSGDVKASSGSVAASGFSALETAFYSAAGTVAFSGSPQSITGLGFTPKALIIVPMESTTEGYIGGSGKVGFGMATATEQCAIATADAAERHDNTKAIQLISGGGATFCEGAVTSMDADGFTFTRTGSGGINYLALGGAQLTNAKIVQFNSATATGDQIISGVGFQPDVILLITLGSAVAPPSTTLNTVAQSIGMATASQQFVISASEVTGGLHFDSWQSSSDVLHVIEPGASPTTRLRASLVEMNTDGFKLNWATVQGTGRYCWALCLKGGAHALVASTAPTSNSQTSVSGGSVTPISAMFFGAGAVTEETIVSDRIIAVGAVDDVGTQWSDFQGEGNYHWRYATRCHQGYYGGAGAPQSRADFNSFSGNNALLDWTETTANARIFYTWMIGAAAPASVKLTVYRTYP